MITVSYVYIYVSTFSKETCFVKLQVAEFVSLLKYYLKVPLDSLKQRFFLNFPSSMHPSTKLGPDIH